MLGVTAVEGHAPLSSPYMAVPPAAVGRGTRIGTLARASFLPSGEVGQGLAAARAPSLDVGVPSPETPPGNPGYRISVFKAVWKPCPACTANCPEWYPEEISSRLLIDVDFFPPVLLLCLEPTLRWRSSP